MTFERDARIAQVREARMVALRQRLAPSGGTGPLLAAVSANPQMQTAVLDEYDERTEIDQLVACVAAGSRSCELALYARYWNLIERLAKLYGTSPVFAAEDAHQTGVIALLRLARNGPSDFQRRVAKTVRYQVANEATRHARPVTGLHRHGVELVLSALREHDGDITAATHALAQARDRNSRIAPETTRLLLQALMADNVRLDTTTAYGRALVDGLTDSDLISAAGERVEELLAALNRYEMELVQRSFGLAGFRPHTDAELGTRWGITPDSAGRARRRVLNQLRRATGGPGAAA